LNISEKFIFPVITLVSCWVNFIFFETTGPNVTKLGRDGPWVEEIKICTKEVDPLWGG
jgi:hypothetical protein